LNQGYRVYTPVLRNPRLFHLNTTRSTSTYYPAQQAAPSSVINSYLPNASRYALQSPYVVQSNLPYLPHYYPYTPASPRFTVPSSIPFSSYSVPTFSYAPTGSSKGLTIILIATLVLAALDLVIVRPQKSRAAVQSSNSESDHSFITLST